MLLELDAFLLTREWRDERDGLRLTYWAWSEQGPVRLLVTSQEAMMFVERAASTSSGRRRELPLTSLLGRPVDAVYFRTQREMKAERERLTSALSIPLESDIKPSDRYLMERFVTGALHLRGEARRERGHLTFVDPQVREGTCDPCLRTVSFDIETDGIGGSLLSIAVAGDAGEHVFMRSDDEDREAVTNHADERSLIKAFLDWIAREDPDVLVGWNVIEFDLVTLGERAAAAGLPLTLGRDRKVARALPPGDPSQPWVARVPGRVVLDGIATMRSATWTFERWGLEHVARELLGRGKTIAEHVDAVEEIRRMYREDRAALAAYNLEDCRLVMEVFERADLLGFAVERQRLTGLPMDRQGGSVAAFDWLYLPRLHRHGHVAPDVGSDAGAITSPGGYVLESQPGLYEHVLVLDFKSLYPSIIRTFLIDPMGLAFPGDDPVEGFGGGRFSREQHILPGLIETLWAARDDAKRRNDAALSRAIKILMNSFYGVLGTPGCRFFSPKLASSITRRGHEIITRSRDWIEARGHPVIYGDTDSLFVHVVGERTESQCREVGAELARDLNAWWRTRVAEEHRVESALEVELETLYLRFFMPTLRGTDRGSKKRYAGLVRAETEAETEIVMKGLEAVRTDWTALARRFQRELLHRVFHDEPYEAWIRSVRDAVFAGELDEELVYRKRLRRSLDDYVKNVPPHVQAARKLDVPVREIAYVMTVRGAEPVQRRTAAIDYEHYVQRQLAPAADALLGALGTDFARIAGRQMSLF